MIDYFIHTLIYSKIDYKIQNHQKSLLDPALLLEPLVLQSQSRQELAHLLVRLVEPLDDPVVQFVLRLRLFY